MYVEIKGKKRNCCSKVGVLQIDIYWSFSDGEQLRTVYFMCNKVKPV
jgi:hypothetical protein